MLRKLFTDKKSIVIETANWLYQHGEKQAAKKVIFEVIKDNPADKGARAAYADMFSKEDLKLNNDQLAAEQDNKNSPQPS